MEFIKENIKYLYIILAIILLIVFIVILVSKGKLNKTSKQLSLHLDKLNGEMNKAKEKRAYIKEVDERSIIPETLLIIKIMNDIRKKHKK